MIFSYNWIQSFFDKRIPECLKLAEELTLHSFEAEEVKKKGKDWILDLDIMPNRADCFSHLGIAREYSAISGLKMKELDLEIKEVKKEVKEYLDIEVREGCPRYMAGVIEGIKVSSSPGWMKEYLESCGLQSINNVVDCANYVMLETGQPLHVFDYDKVEGKIIVRKANKGEKISALDEKTYSLDKDILVIADEKKILAIAGIKGGWEAGVDKKTKNIVIESANFDSKIIRRASQKLNLRTDASLRFEHNFDSNMAEIGIKRVLKLIQEIAGGKILKGRIDICSKKISPLIINFDINSLEKLLGLKISEKSIVNTLERLGIKVLSSNKNILELEIPTWRGDLKLDVDIIEEIIRIYGLDKLKSSLPKISLAVPEKNDEVFWENRIKDLLKESGFSEIYTYSFIKKEDGRFFKKDLIGLNNPISEEFFYLRPSLIINLLRTTGLNLKNFKNIKVFESGKIFRKNKGLVEEKKMLSVLICSKEENKGFHDLKAVLDDLFVKLGITDYYLDDYQVLSDNIWHKKKVAEIKVSKKKIGFIGEISLKILDYFNLPRWIFVFDIDFEKLIQECSEEYEYREISKFPAAVRDLAVLVPVDVKTAEVLNIVSSVGGKNIRDVELFDFYQGPELPDGMKNLGFHIIYQSQEKTLSGGEIDKIHKKIIDSLEENLDWQVRK